jgi:hypothetical protein
MGSGGLGSSQEETIVVLPAPGIANQVPSDVRWAPAPVASGDATSDYEAALAAPDAALAAALASGARAESAHLATVPLPATAGRVNPSDDRIAAAFGES